jgi:membrane protein CcdC involved in cytochrome C biogenesis
MDYSIIIIGLVVAGLIIWRRTRSMYRPIHGKGYRILVPLFFLIPGVSFLFSQPVEVAPWEWWAAVGVGVALSLPLIWTTNYERREDKQIYAVRNKGFFISFIAIVAFRLLLRDYLVTLDEQATTMLVLTMAIGYLIPWRIVSFLKFRKLHGASDTDATILSK